MTEKTVTVSNPQGLISKTATAFIQKANEYPCSILVESNDRRVNGKSLLGVLSLSLKCGDSFQLSADGAQEADAIEILSKMF